MAPIKHESLLLRQGRKEIVAVMDVSNVSKTFLPGGNPIKGILSLKNYSQTRANDYLRIAITCLQRPPFLCPSFHVYNKTFFIWRQILWEFCKLVETFHIASECRTAVYFGWWFTLQVQVARWLWPLILLHCFILWQTKSLHLVTEIVLDCTRLSLLQ